MAYCFGVFYEALWAIAYGLGYYPVLVVRASHHMFVLTLLG